MRTFISAELAQQYWRYQSILGLPPAHPTTLTRVHDEAWRTSDIEAAGWDWLCFTIEQANNAGIFVEKNAPLVDHLAPGMRLRLSATVDVLVSSQNHRHQAGPHARRLFSQELPPGHLYQMEGCDIIIPSPELTLVLLMTVLPTDAARAMAAYEFCGHYSVLPHGFTTADGNGFVERPSLTTVEKCQELVEAAPRLKGAGILRRILKDVQNDSASIQESKTDYLFGSHEGFGLRSDGLNRRVALSAEARKIARKHTAYADIIYTNRHWQQDTHRIKGMVLEYQGMAGHYRTASQAASDNRRRRALEHDGWLVAFITGAEFNSFDDMLTLFAQLVRAIDVKPSVYLSPERINRARKLHLQLSDPDLGR